MLHKCGAQESVVQREKEGMATQAKYLVHALRDGDKSEHSGKNDGGVVGGIHGSGHISTQRIASSVRNRGHDQIGAIGGGHTCLSQSRLGVRLLHRKMNIHQGCDNAQSQVERDEEAIEPKL